MARNRNVPAKSAVDIVDSSLVVATLQDVLFNPLEVGGEEFLQLRAFRLERMKKELNVGKTYEMDSEEDTVYLKSLEPTEWKDQDHYAVLGLKHMRFKASDDEIRKAYRVRVLKHHPDKRMGAGEQVNPECDYFACIVKAFEVLTAKRQSYDSIDPEFDDYVPSKSQSSKDDFFTVYGKWFELNSRWSVETPVPLLGNESTPREKVDRFYAFWYDFESWREYSYLDEEEKEKGQYREERRWIDKQNKAARAKLKKEEMARIRQAVDNAYAVDPRIVKFKAQDNEEKLAKKLEKKKTAMEKLEQAEKLRKEQEDIARVERERLEAEVREKELAAKREKEAVKKVLKKERKTLRTVCKTNEYYGDDEKTKVVNMASLETFCEVLELKELEELNKELSAMSLSEGKATFLLKAEEINRKIQEEKAASTQGVKGMNMKGDAVNQNGNVNGTQEWSTEELSLLIKAVNLFPAGTVQRWEVVANFLHQHNPECNKKRSAKEVLAKAKDLKESDFSKSSLKEEVNRQAYTVFERTLKPDVKVEAEETVRDSGDISKAKSSKMKSKSNPVSSTGTDPEEPKSEPSTAPPVATKPWTAEEQKMLEQALKTFPSSHSDRWDRIAECVPGRSKKECMARFKELAALIKAKKMAQQT